MAQHRFFLYNKDCLFINTVVCYLVILTYTKIAKEILHNYGKINLLLIHVKFKLNLNKYIIKSLKLYF